MAGETTLYYFDGRGRAEIIRMVLCAANIQVSTKLWVLHYTPSIIYTNISILIIPASKFFFNQSQ